MSTLNICPPSTSPCTIIVQGGLGSCPLPGPGGAGEGEGVREPALGRPEDTAPGAHSHKTLSLRTTGVLGWTILIVGGLPCAL